GARGPRRGRPRARRPAARCAGPDHPEHRRRPPPHAPRTLALAAGTRFPAANPSVRDRWGDRGGWGDRAERTWLSPAMSPELLAAIASVVAVLAVAAVLWRVLRPRVLLGPSEHRSTYRILHRITLASPPLRAGLA